MQEKSRLVACHTGDRKDGNVMDQIKEIQWMREGHQRDRINRQNSSLSSCLPFHTCE